MENSAENQWMGYLMMAVFVVGFFSVWYGFLVVLVFKVVYDWWEIKKLSQETGSNVNATVRGKKTRVIATKEGHRTEYLIDYDFEAVRNDGMKLHVSVKGREVSDGLYEELEVGQMEPVRFMSNAPQHCRLEKVLSEKDRDKTPPCVIFCGFLGLLLVVAIFAGAPLCWVQSITADSTSESRAATVPGGFDPLVILGLLVMAGTSCVVVNVLKGENFDYEFTVLKPGSKSRSVNLEELGHEDLDSYDSEALSDSDDA